MESSTTEDSHNNTIDPDYSLNDLFETDWNISTKTVKDNTESQGEQSCSVTETPDPDFTLDDCFNIELIYVPKKEKKMSIPPESVINIIRYGPISKFIKLLDSGYELDVLNDKGQTALHLIFYEKAWQYFDVLQMKLSSYPHQLYNNNFTDCEGLTHLHVACIKGNLALVSTYLHNNDNINACFKGNAPSIYGGFTALHFAVMNSTTHKKEIVKSLIEHGADVNAVDVRGRTPLHIASQVFVNKNDTNSDGKTNVEVMNIILENKSSINARDSDGNTPLLSAFSPNYQEFQVDNYRYFDDDAFHVSVYMPDIKEKLKFFLQYGADVTATNNSNEIVLHLILENLKLYRYQFQNANYIFDDSDHLDMIKQIFNANPNIDSNLKNNNGETPLQMAIACMSSRIVEILLDHGADFKDLKFECNGQRRGFFCYPNMVAIFEPIQDLINVLDLLSSKGFNLNLKDNIVILDFLLHRDENCDCYSYPYTNIKLALHYGYKDHVVEVLQRLYANLDLYEGSGDPEYLDAYNDERLEGTEELYSDLMEYLDTTRIGNIYSDGEIIETVKNINEFILSERFDPDIDYQKYIDKDLNILKNTTFENNVSLLDVLKKNPLNTPRSILNEFDLRMIENLHCYKDAVKGHITKARVRYLFEKYFGDYLGLIFGPLPDTCYRMIVNYFSNDDILLLSYVTLVLKKL